MIFDSILDTVGRTPIVRLRRMTVDNGSEILVKLESFNPGGSIKDRAALSMVTAAEQDGRLVPGGTIIESTSGNVGKALSLIGAIKGYRVILVIDRKAPRSMMNFATALGAELIMVTTPDESGGYQRPRREKVKQLLAEIPNSFWPNQMHNPDNPRAHAERTAYEVLDAVDEFDALVATVSTGGQVTGLATTVKRERPEVTTIAVDAVGSAAFGFPFHGYQMRGLGLAWKPGNLDYDLVDRVHLVADHEGIATMRLLATTEGVLVGESAGAALFGALHHAHHHPGSRIVVVAADGGVNYMDESFDDDWLALRGLTDRITEAGLTDPESLVAAARHPFSPAIPWDDVLTIAS